MKFRANRKIMLEYLKSMSKVIPKSGPIEELKGFLIEANEEDGYLYMTANNLESAIVRKFETGIEEGGTFVMDAKLLLNMLSLLGGDMVDFEQEKPGTLKLKSGKCVYTVKVMDAKVYPKPEMPFPDTTVKVTGMKRLYTKTNAAAAKDENTRVLSGIHVDIYKNSMRAVGCDTRGVSVSVKNLDCGGELSFTLSKTAFSYLASAAGDDDLEVSMSGTYVVFMKEGMLFSTKPYANEYIDVDLLFKSINAEYLAKVEYDEFKDAVGYISDIASMGSETSYVKLEFSEDRIDISTANDVGSGKTEIGAVIVDGTANKSFYYPAPMLKDIFKTVEGTLLIQLDKKGYMLVFDKYSKCMITPLREISVKKQAEKFKAKKKKTTQTKKAA